MLYFILFSLVINEVIIIFKYFVQSDLIMCMYEYVTVFMYVHMHLPLIFTALFHNLLHTVMCVH